MAKLSKDEFLMLKLLKENDEVSNDTYAVLKDIFSKNPELRQKLSHVNTDKEKAGLLKSFIKQIGVPSNKLSDIENSLRDTASGNDKGQDVDGFNDSNNEVGPNDDTSFDKREDANNIPTKDHNTSVDGGKPSGNSWNESIIPRMSKNDLLNTLNKNSMADDKWKKIVAKALAKGKSGSITESKVNYGDTTERMLPKLERELHDHKHSLGVHPIFPESDETSFEEKIVGDRFIDVVNSVKRHFNVEKIDNNFIIQNMGIMVGDSMQSELGHEKELEELAIQMIVDEYDIPEGAIEFDVELTPNISLEGTKPNPTPKSVETEFENHDEIELANKEVYKRRFINAMTQGAAKKSTHMFHLVDDELSRINPRLPNQYSKMMAAADYMYYIFDGSTEKDRVNGGVVRVEFPKNGGVPKIIAKAVVFPVLIHELVKGVMEILASHGLPKDKKIQKWALDKADFVAAEAWDMRLGPGLWEKFIDTIPAEDFNLKHYIYMELVSLPVDEFNTTMREIMAGTNSGKQTVLDIIKTIKDDIQKEEFDEAISKQRKEFKPESDDNLSSKDLDNIDLDDWI